MGRCSWAVLALLCVAAGTVSVATAETVEEAWRSPLGIFRSLSVNQTDGTCWVATGAFVLHLAPDGTILTQIGGLSVPSGVAVNSQDGSCWVSERGTNDVVHFSVDGQELSRTPDLTVDLLVVNTTDGSCWVSRRQGEFLWHLAADGTQLWEGDLAGVVAFDVNPTDGSVWVSNSVGFFHLAADGTQLWQLADAHSGLPNSVSVDVTDGSVWTALGSALAHFSASGSELLNQYTTAAAWVSADPSGGSVWVGEPDAGDIVQVAADGTLLQRVALGTTPALAGFPRMIDPKDGSLWVVYGGGWTSGGDFYPMMEWESILHVGRDGTVLWRGESRVPSALSADTRDGSCWVSYSDQQEAVRFAGDGTQLDHFTDLAATSLSVRPADGSLWAAIYNAVVHLDADGGQLLQIPNIQYANVVSVNSRDGSCWIGAGYHQVHGTSLAAGTPVRAADSTGNGIALHVAADGTQLGLDTNFGEIVGIHTTDPVSVSTDSGDGSCWVAAFYVVHVASDGTELWRSDNSLSGCASVSADPTDGSCWAGGWDDTMKGWVAHLARDGSVLLRVGNLPAISSVAVNPADGTCWAAAYTAVGTVIHFAADGTELSRRTDFYRPMAVSVDPMTGSCWVADTGNRQVVRLAVAGYQPPAFIDVPLTYWASAEIEACVKAGIVTGFPDGTYQPDTAVTRDQMAVFVARALAGGEVKVPSAPAGASFPDVPADSWAFRYIEYCKEKGIVTGYPDGLYHPADPVTRAQMAVFVTHCFIASPTAPAEAVFPDVPADYWAASYIAYCKDKGIVQGFPDGTYQPEVVVTRDQMAVYVARAFQLQP